jgi:hypothetical protein
MKYLTVLLATFLFAAAASAEEVDVRKLIADAIATKQTKVAIPPGVHKVAPPTAKATAHLSFEGANGLEIDGQGATIVFTDPEVNGLFINRSKGLVLKNLKFDYDPLPFTQGTITGLDPAANAFMIRIDEGYLPNPKFFTGSNDTFVGGRMAAYLFDAKTGQWKTDAFDMYPNRFELIDPQTVKLGFASAEAFKRYNGQVGDRIVISRRSSSAIRLNFCENAVVENVTIYAAGGIGMHEASGNGNNRFTRLQITRGPTPAGATVPRLHSLCADGFHSSAVKKGPIVEDSLFEWMGDDSIAVHGTYALATGQPSATQITVSPKFELPFEVGDELTIIDGQTYKLKATAKVQKTEPTQAKEDAAVTKLWETYKLDTKSRKFYTLTVDKETPIAVGDLVTSPQRIGNGYIVRNNVCRNHRARAIQMKAGDGLIENNTIENVNFAGITLGPELSIWLGSDYVKNVVVRGNTIRNTGFGGEGRQNPNFADIASIAIRSLTLDRKLSPAENANITIENNRIENPAGLAMFLSSTKGLIVRNNTIIKPWALGPSVSGKKFGVDPTAAVFVAASEDVTFDGNVIELAGSGVTQAVRVGEGVKTLTGADTGFMLKPVSPAASPR